MEFLSKSYSALQPKHQLAEETIQKLSDRLENATLLEDRRSAIQSLRSLARDYHEIVASEGLRSVLSLLSSEDKNDDEILRNCAESLSIIMENCADDTDSEITGLWIADEILMRHDVVEALAEALERNDFYVQMSILRLFYEVAKRRRASMQHCIVICPLAVSRICNLLESPREAVRNMAILLLTELAKENMDMQKIIAFDSCIDSLLNILGTEGILVESIVSIDCLCLLIVLLEHNATNQTFFRESDNSKKFEKIIIDTSFDLSSVTLWNSRHSDSIILLLKTILSFQATASYQLKSNQAIFMHLETLQAIVRIAFHPDICTVSKCTAFKVIAFLLEDNPVCQNIFMTMNHESFKNTKNSMESKFTPFVQALLSLILNDDTPHVLRNDCLLTFYSHVKGGSPAIHGICECIQYLYIQEKDSLDPTLFNILGHLVVMNERSSSNIVWSSGMILMLLISADHDTKLMWAELPVQEDENTNSKTLLIQAVAAHFVTQSYNHYDHNLSAGLLMLLSMWLFECPKAISLLLEDTSFISALLSYILQTQDSNILVQGLCSLLILIIYGFNPEDSPVSRESILEQVSKRNTCDLIIHKFYVLRSCPQIREFPFDENSDEPSHIRFEHTFISFFKDNYTRLQDAFDQEPGLVKRVKPKGPTQEEQAIQLLQAELAQKKEECILRQNEMIEMKTQLEEQLKQIHQKDAQVKRLETLEAEHNEKLSHIKKLEGELETLQKKFNTASETVQNSERIIKEQKTEMISKDKQITELKLTMEADGKELKNWKKTFELERAKVKSSEAKIKESNAELLEMKLKLESASQAVSAEKNKASKALEDVKSLQDLNAKLKTELENTSKQRDSEISQNRALKANIGQLESKHVHELQQIKSNHEKAILELKDTMNKDIEKLHSQLSKAHSENASTLAKMKESDDEWLLVIEDLEKKCEKYKAKLMQNEIALSDVDESDAA